jgi:hypothetical protein
MIQQRMESRHDIRIPDKWTNHLKQCFLIINVVIEYHDPFQDRAKDHERSVSLTNPP